VSLSLLKCVLTVASQQEALVSSCQGFSPPRTTHLPSALNLAHSSFNHVVLKFNISNQPNMFLALIKASINLPPAPRLKALWQEVVPRRSLLTAERLGRWGEGGVVGASSEEARRLLFQFPSILGSSDWCVCSPEAASSQKRSDVALRW